MPPREEQYPPGDDGLVVEKVGAWAKTKHKLLTDYIQASGGARSKYYRRSGAAYIDTFCGPGRLLIRDTQEYIDGSPMAAFKRGKASSAPFSSIEISDVNAKLLVAAETRLRALSAPVVTTPGPAVDAMQRIVNRVHPNGLHFVFLDPHNLGALSFELSRLSQH
jgi:three-Cys-motif partner protein